VPGAASREITSGGVGWTTFTVALSCACTGLFSSSDAEAVTVSVSLSPALPETVAENLHS
jgi:hypothetical protein